MSDYWNDASRLLRAAGIAHMVEAPAELKSVEEAPESDDDAYLDGRIADMDAASEQSREYTKKVKNQFVHLGFDADDITVDVDENVVIVMIDISVTGMPLSHLVTVQEHFGDCLIAPYDGAKIELRFKQQ